MTRPYLSLGSGISAAGPKNFPATANPFFAVVLARHVRADAAGPILSDPEEINGRLEGLIIPSGPGPDHVVLGRSNIVLPVIPDPADPGNTHLRSPFLLPFVSTFVGRVAPDLAFGISLVSLLEAIDWIRLGVMPWHSILADALGIPIGKSKDPA